MEHEFCPLCGSKCAVEESTPGDSSIPPEEEAAAVEAVADVAVAALETVAEVVHEHEESDRTAATAEMLETMAEESSEAAVVEALADDPEEPEPEGAHDEVEAHTEEEPAPEEAPEDEPPEDEGEIEANQDSAHEEDATPVNAPPQLREEPETRARARRSAPAFRRHRAGARRR